MSTRGRAATVAMRSHMRVRDVTRVLQAHRVRLPRCQCAADVCHAWKPRSQAASPLTDWRVRGRRRALAWPARRGRDRRPSRKCWPSSAIDSGASCGWSTRATAPCRRCAPRPHGTPPPLQPAPPETPRGRGRTDTARVRAPKPSRGAVRARQGVRTAPRSHTVWPVPVS